MGAEQGSVMEYFTDYPYNVEQEYFPVGVLGRAEPTSDGRIPDGIFTRAERCHDRTSVDALAFNPVAGNIIRPGHWLHQADRDRFNSILNLTPEDYRRIQWLEA